MRKYWKQGELHCEKQCISGPKHQLAFPEQNAIKKRLPVTESSK